MIRCKKHHTTQYSKQYDCHLCRDCDRWLEKKCQPIGNKQECLLCLNRPRRPSMDKK